MELFKRKIKFVSAVCHICGKALRLDPKLETAYCQYCGGHCIIENASKRSKNPSKLEIVLDYLERRDNQNRMDKVKIEEKHLGKEKKANEWWSKYWRIIPVSIVTLLVFSVLMSFVEKM